MIKLNSLRWKAVLTAASCVGAAAAAQSAAAQEGNTQIGPPQLRDFQLEPRQRIVTQPRPAPETPAETAPPPADNPAPRLTPAPAPQTNRPNPAQRPAAPAAAAPAGPSRPTAAPQPGRTAGQTVERPTAAEPAPLPTASAPAETVSAPPAEPIALPEPVPTAAAGTDLPEGPPAWLYFLAFATLGLLGYGLWLRRRTTERRAVAAPGALMRQPAAPPVEKTRAPRPAPQPRPWLELELKAERATIDLDETVVEFELHIRNSGGTEARNVRLQARMFSSTPEQDKQITAYFKGNEADYRTIALPPIPAGEDIRIKGSVDMDRDRISALRVQDKLLLIPLVAVTARYEWGANRFGQTGRSWVIGREQGEAAGKMAPFRLAETARVHRTVGERPHSVGRRI